MNPAHSAGDLSQTPDGEAFHIERAVRHLQNAFEGKVDAEVIRHVLSECQWKVEDAVIKLGHLVAKFDERGSVPQPTRVPEPAQYAHGIMQSNARHHNLSLKLSSKIPLSSGDMATLPMLSPKTPHVGELEYSPFAGNLIHDSDLSMGQAMEALQLYAQQPAAQLPPTPDVYILQHGQFTAGAGGGHAVSPHMQTPHPLTMPPPNMMPVTSPVIPVTNPMMPVMNPVTSPMNPVTGPMHPLTSPMNPVTGPMMPVTSPISAENMYSLQMQCARLTSPDNTITMVTNEAQFPASYHMDKNASFYPSADPFRATQNLYDVQHSGENVSAGWFAPPPDITESQYTAAAPQTEQAVAVDAADTVPIELIEAAKASRASKKIFRTKAYSLNPEEREALENLIEDVIIGGVDNEVMTSDDSDSESDSDSCVKVGSENKDGNENAEGLPKVYPAQLKVAVKHMKNLPPRFLKKIHAAPKIEGTDDVDLTFEVVKSPEEKIELRTMEREREKNIKVEGQKRDIKKKIRNMLQGLDSYVEENVVLVDEECREMCESVDVVAEEPLEEVPPVSLAPVVPDTERKVLTRDSSPMLGAPAQRIVLKPNVINCSDLERELLGEPLQSEKKSTFSIDAPEFVPRSFTPIPCCASPAPVACPPPPATTSPYRASGHGGHNSPQPFVSSQLHLSHSQINGPVQRRSPTPACMLPKVAYPVSTPATVVRMRFPQYPPPTYNAAAIPQFNPILQPSFVPPGFGMQDLGAAHAAAQGVYPVYMSPQVKPVNPYVLSPHSSPKAMHRVIDSTVIHGMPMQPILIPQHVPRLSPNAQLADPNYTALYTAGLANMYRHLSPHSSPKVRRSGAVDGDVDRSAIAALKLKVHGLVASGKKVMIIMRGLPGSGKSTLARELQGNGVILSTDNFFTKNGKYEMDYSKLTEAHDWNRHKAKEAVDAGVSPIIIDNTNVQSWEMKPYVALALKYGYHVEIVEPPTQWRYKPKVLAEKNVHHVMFESLRRMLDNFDRRVTVESIMRVAATHAARSPAKDDLDPDLPLSEDAAEGKKPVRRRKRKRRKRKRKTAQEGGKTNEGDSSDDDSGAEADESVEKLSEEGTEGTDGQGNLQCPSCRRQGGHITSLAGLAKAQYDRMGAGGLLYDVNHVPSSGQGESRSVGIVEENSCLASSPPRDIDLTHEYSSDQDVVIESSSQVLIQNGSVSPEELDENGNNSSMSQQLGGFLSKPGGHKDDDDKEDELSSMTDDMIMMTPETAIRKKVTFNLDLSQKGDIFDVEIADSTTVESMRIREREDLLINGSEEDGANIDVDCGDGDSSQTTSVSAPEAFSCDATMGSIDDGSEVTTISFGSDDAVIQKIPGPSDELSYEVAIPFCDLSQEVARPDSEVSLVTGPASELSLDVTRLVNELSLEITQPGSELSQVVTRSTSELSQEISGPASELSLEIGSPASELSEGIPGPPEDSTQNSSVTPPQVGTECQPDDDRWASEITTDVESSPDPCPAALTDDEKWTEMFEKSEVLRGDIGSKSGDGARLPKQRRRQEKVNVFMAADQLDLGDLVSWRSLNEVVSAPVTPVAKSNPGFYRLASCSAFPGGMTQQDEPFPSPRECVKDAMTITHPQDFSLLHKVVKSIPFSSGLVPGHRVVCCTPRVISDAAVADDDDGLLIRNMVAVTHDKGCSTGDLLVAPSVDGVEFLHRCFPEVSKDDLSYILSTCGGDIEWAANVLLDTGYEYSYGVDDGMADNTDVGNSTDVAKESIDMDVAKSLKCADAFPASDPPVTPSLFCLCYSSIAPDILASGALLEVLSDNDMARLRMVKHFIETLGKPAGETFVSDDNDISDRCTALIPGGSSEVDESAGGTLVLELSDSLAAQLVRLFGPVDVDMSDGDALSVSLDTATARQLHQLWVSSVIDRKSAKPQNTLLKDEELARRLQQEEDDQYSNYTPSPRSSPYRTRSTSPQKRHQGSPLSLRELENAVLDRVDQRNDWVANGDGGVGERERDDAPASLKEIMEEEEALHLSRKEYETLRSVAADEIAISTRLKRQKLLEMFPYVDPTVLVDVFKSSLFNLETTREIIEELFSSPGSPIVDPSSFTLGGTLTEEQLLTWPDELDGHASSRHHKYSDEDMRSDAAMHYRLRLECFEKARAAYSRRMMGVAAFYSQQGHVHTQKMKAANEEAVGKILNHRNPHPSQGRFVDLHGLHVSEAINTLTRLLADRERELRRLFDKRKRHLLVMTGKGSHSRGGVARIRLAVIDYLKRNNYRYTEPQPGLVKILLKYHDAESFDLSKFVSATRQ